MYEKHDVPNEYLTKWQKTLNVVSEILDVPAALIMRVWPEEIEVLVASIGEENPYEEHEKASLATGLYCETVMATRKQVMVPNALEDPAWKDNPDTKLNMISYLGLPLIWPDNTIFGTMCVLDSKTRYYSQAYQDLLWQLKEIIERDFRMIQHTQEVEWRKCELEDQIQVRTAELRDVNQQLKDLELRVQERTAELESKIKDLELLNKVFIDRELKMVELKEKIKELQGKGEGG